MSLLKPFVINETDIQFLLDQINFRPLFDADGNAIILWDGTGAIYDGRHNLVWDGVLTQTVSVPGIHNAGEAIALYGTSYQSVTDLAGLRDVTGFNNNLSQVNATWGSVDQIFTRSAAADYAGYSPIVQGVATAAYAAAKAYYGKYSDGSATDGTPTGVFNSGAVLNTSYAITHDTTASVLPGDAKAADGTPINIQNVVDYTPRMISQLTTTAGVTYDTWANHSTDPAAASHGATEIFYDSNGLAKVTDWGMLATVKDGGLGQVDTQARLAASAGQDDHFIGGLNPGVSPSNGFFVLFGQFFDHGLDFVGKASGATIKIALAADDPLYGMLGADGQPVHEITISRATVQTLDANGPEYTNHTSPFIDQSQTYGSHAQLTTLLREWVKDPATGQYHAGMKLLDGNTLGTAWTKADGTVTHETLPTFDELRTHVLASGRDGLTWEDVNDLRNRDASGHVIAGTSGSALLLDMNPRFDAGHMFGFYDTDGDGVQGAGEASYGNAALSARVTAAIATIDADVKATFGAGSSFGIDATTHKLTLHMGTLPAGSPAGTPQTLTGASALFPYVKFADFSITTPPGLLHDAVGEILMASVGDHYVAGDGRVNENFGLTSIHHVFHEEHNYQIDNLIEALHRQDITSNDASHAALHGFQVDTGHMNGSGDFVYSDGSIAWDQDKMFSAGKLIVEMEYQHAAVDQYARNVTPNIQEFVGYSSSVNSAVSLEYSQAAFRFGHSTLRETIDTIDPSHGLTGKIMGYALKEAFLSPEKFADIGPSAIVLGMSHQQMNEVDEFVTPALTQGLLGQPLDLAAINIARGRDIGIPTLNEFRDAIGLSRYTSWTDFGQNMQHPSSLVNFIAAYSFDGNMAKANAILGLVDGTISNGDPAAMGFSVSDAYAFVDGGDRGFDHIDTWLGGLAEVHQPGGLLGETFDKVFVNQIESLMDGDRFYYLYRLAGQQFAEEVGNGQLKDIVERNTGLTHLNGNIFGYADQYVDLGAHKEIVAPGAEAQTVGNEHKWGDIAAVADGSMGVYSNGGRGNLNDGHEVVIGGTHYIQDTRLADADPHSAYAQNDGVNLDGSPNSGAESNEVIVGTKGSDLIYAQGGDDTAYGDGGNDILYGGFGIDRLYGGDGGDRIYGGDNPDLIDGGSGDDVLYGESSGSDINGADQVIGGSGNDYISGGIGIDKLSGGTGDDRIYGDQDTDPFTHGSDGNDYVDGGSGGDILYGDNGDDVLVGGGDQDQLFGGNGDDILRPGDTTGALTIGTDEVLGGDGVTDAGNGPATTGFDIVDFSDNAVRPGGVRFDLSNQTNPATTVNGTPTQIATFQIEGVIGSAGGDGIIGDDGANWLIGGSGNDAMTGAGGNDVIVGGSIRLDALIGRYVDANGNPSTYDHNNGNDGSTEALRIQDARYDGASHRVGYADVLSGGLLGSAGLADLGFDKHFTEMLRSEIYKDLVLGDGSPNGGSDTVAYSGTLASYTLVAIDANGATLATPHANWASVAAVRITDNRTASDFLDANGNPLTGVGGTPLSNEGTDVVIGVQKFAFVDQTVDIQAYFDKAPTLDLDYRAGTISIASDALNSSPAYGRGTGWTGNWTETGDVTGAGGTFNPATTGAIQRGVTNGNGYLQFVTASLAGAGGDGAAIGRSIDLSGHAAPTLSFDLTKSGIGAGETLALQYSGDGGVSYSTLRTYGDGTGGTVGATGLQTVDLSGQALSADAMVRFSVNHLNGAVDYFRVDNVAITEVGDTHPGNGYATTYAERGTAVAIAAVALIADPDDLTNASARIVLRDGIAGDQLNLGALTGGITASKVTATEIDLTGVASHAAYQAAIAAITFSDPNNHNPTSVDRHIDVTVNDGIKDSAVATTTVHVTPVNDAPTARADHVITNFANGTAFAVADWMLLANDTDLDGPTLKVAGVVQNSPNNLFAVHGANATSTTVTDNGAALGGTFDYTLNDGSGTATATATGHVVVEHASQNAVAAGTAADDIFVLAANNVQDRVDGQAGTNTVDYSAYATSLSVDFSAAITPVVVGTGSDAAHSDILAGIQNLVTGSGSDRVVVAVDNIRNVLDGGSGTDTLDFSHYTSGLSFDLSAASANPGGFATVVGSGADGAHSDLVRGFETILAGGGADTMTVGSGTTTFTGNGGHDTMVFTSTTIKAGTARDVFSDFTTHAGASAPPSADQIDLTALGVVNVGHANAGFQWNGQGAEFVRGSGAEIRYHIEGIGANAHTILDYHAAGGGTAATGSVDLGLGNKTLVASGPNADILHL